MAAKALAVMLRKIEGMWRRQEQSVVGADGSGAECLNESRPLDGDTLALDAAWSDLNSTTFDLNPNLSIPPHDLPSNDFPLIGDMLDVPDDIDWGTWDYQISGQAGQEFPLYNEWPLSENRPGGGIAVEDLMR
ncbi:hypothetical protein H2203_005971 [Taxawa tesnikishii (nom. ined.)]|nr:hypothetical protein H2203_005971 [Dothideales sp. JES 119]